MFTHAAIANLNGLEMLVYNFVIKNRDKVMYMTIRELADAVGVSTTTVLRFCRKLNCEGYSEFRVRLKLYLEQHDEQLELYYKSLTYSQLAQLAHVAQGI